PSWPIPIHHGCRCTQSVIAPGADAPEPFVNCRVLLDQMPRDQQVAAIGASNYKLLRAGVVSWEDIVTPSRVRDFREVVANRQLSLGQLKRAGVSRVHAERAMASVHTPEHEHAERQRKELIECLKGAGLAHEHTVNELARRIAARVKIAEQA